MAWTRIRFNLYPYLVLKLLDRIYSVISICPLAMICQMLKWDTQLRVRNIEGLHFYLIQDTVNTFYSMYYLLFLYQNMHFEPCFYLKLQACLNSFWTALYNGYNLEMLQTRGTFGQNRIQWHVSNIFGDFDIFCTSTVLRYILGSCVIMLLHKENRNASVMFPTGGFRGFCTRIAVGSEFALKSAMEAFSSKIALLRTCVAIISLHNFWIFLSNAFDILCCSCRKR